MYVHFHALCHRVSGELPFGLDGSRVPFTCVHSHALCHRVAGELPFGLDGSRVPFTCVPLPFQS